MTNRERISGVDTAWLRMDEPTNLMMIVSVIMFDRKVAERDVRRLIERRFLGYRRFRQRAVQDAAGAWWEDAADFDIANHVRRVSLPGAAGKRELQALVSRLASTPLDPSRPLWEFDLVDDYEGGSALILRIHHCYADGMALIQVVLSLTHETAAGSLALAPKPVEASSGGRGEADFWQQVLKPVAGALGGAAQLGRGLLEQGRSLASQPQLAGEAAQEAARKGVGFAGEIVHLLTMGSDAATRFKGPLGTAKRAAWAEPLPLEEVKAVGKALGCSINDVLLSMAAGALRDYLADKGDAVDGLEIRAIVPVNLRPKASDMSGLGNQFGLVFLDLPVGMEHPLERLYEVRRRMLQLKGSYQPVIALGLLSAVGYGPRALQEMVKGLLSASASAVMTNVPGPQAPLYFAGKRIRELEFWVPQSGGIGMGVSILSYDGRIHFGVITDAGLVPDPDRIVERFGDEFDKLMWITLMSPWQGDTDAQPPSSKKKVPKRFRNL
ncbi:MAG TPA: wax ester/triacylglycerol synthase family O-acyltransferase [Usitatibacter sp.]|nr:wax ester/triacylglycerol synthase family O-acyltransferase [Usitatibacter sp.]